LYRGKGRNKSFKPKNLVINLKFLSLLPKDTIVTKEALVKFKLLKKEDTDKFKVKILGEGDIKHPLTIKLPISKSAAKKVEAAGGKIENN
jgi:large subunit ribosomal protein L15